MGNCLSAAQGGREEALDASKKLQQESQAGQGRQAPPACKEEGPRAQKDKLAPSISQPHKNDSAKDLSSHGRKDKPIDSAFDWLSECKQLKGVVHDYAAGPPVCANEAGRIQTFTAYGLDKLPEPCPELDVVMQAVCKVFQAPYASIALYHNRHCIVCNTVGGSCQGWYLGL